MLYNTLSPRSVLDREYFSGVEVESVGPPGQDNLALFPTHGGRDEAAKGAATGLIGAGKLSPNLWQDLTELEVRLIENLYKCT